MQKRLHKLRSTVSKDVETVLAQGATDEESKNDDVKRFKSEINLSKFVSSDMIAGAKPLHDELERLMKQSSFNFENFANAKESDILNPSV